MEKTLDLAKRLNPDTAQFFPLMVYPGTRAYDWAMKEKLVTAKSYSEWLTPEGLHNTVVDRPDLPHEEIVDFCNRARREFYLRPRYILGKLKQVFTHPGETRRLMKSMKLAIINYRLKTLVEFFELPLSSYHRAMADSLHVKDLFLKYYEHNPCVKSGCLDSLNWAGDAGLGCRFGDGPG